MQLGIGHGAGFKPTVENFFDATVHALFAVHVPQSVVLTMQIVYTHHCIVRVHR